MNPSRFFRTGGGPCTLPSFGCGPWVGIIVLAVVVIIAVVVKSLI
jgi:hypothetical protein